MRYGQDPDDVRAWSLAKYDEAFIVWQGEGEYKVTEDEVKEDQQRIRKGGVLLSHPHSYWAQFIREGYHYDGPLDTAAILKKGYRAEQLEFIESEMRRFGWLAPDGDESC